MDVTVLWGELEDIERSWPPDGCSAHRPTGVIDSVYDLLEKAEQAATGAHAARGFRSWWTRLRTWCNGECIEAAYRHVHRAEAEIAKLYDTTRADAAIPEAVARLNSNLSRHDLRREDVSRLLKEPLAEKVQRLGRAIQIGHEAKDQSYARVRRFRNIVTGASVAVVVFLGFFAVFATLSPGLVPLCFLKNPSGPEQFCPAGATVASRGDVWVVVLLGLLGGSLAAAVSIRKIRGTPTPYNLATALAILKIPLGALTAVGALILIRGEVFPGLSAAVGSQQQILAYALIFGYAQQTLTSLIDKKASDLITLIPTKNEEGGSDADGRARTIS